MTDDREIAKQALDLQSRARDYSLAELPGYSAWSERKLDEGESPALIANLDARSMWLLPEEVGEIGNEDYEEILDDVKETIRKQEEGQ
jgi:hypothetical protein